MLRLQRYNIQARCTIFMIQNSSNISQKVFPRELTQKENDFLFSILPEEKIGYKIYREKIKSYSVIGFGRFGNTNLVLGRVGNKPDLDIPSSQIYACGVVECKEGNVDILIHEEIENEIEFDISFQFDDKIPNHLTEIKRWSYSDWNPGEQAPKDDSVVREIVIIDNEFVLAIAPRHKKIWLHDSKNGVNFLLPVTNFYNYLMITKNIRDSKIILNNKLLFEDLNNFTDAELISAFISYNKYFRKFNIDYNLVKVHHQLKNKNKRFTFFKRNKH